MTVVLVARSFTSLVSMAALGFVVSYTCNPSEDTPVNGVLLRLLFGIGLVVLGSFSRLGTVVPPARMMIPGNAAGGGFVVPSTGVRALGCLV